MNNDDRVVTFVIDSLGLGGAERVTSILANYFCNGKKVNLIVYYPADKKYNIDKRVNLINMNYVVEKNILKNIRQAIDVCSIISSFGKKQTVISLSCPSTNFYLSFVLKSISHHNLILSERNAPQFYPSSWLGRICRNVSYEMSDYIVFQTNGAKSYFGKRIQKKGGVIYNPIKENLPLPFEGKREKIIVNFCRLHPQKNLHLLIDAFCDFVKIEKEYRLFIYGEGPQKKELEEKINDLNLKDKIFICSYDVDLLEKIKNASMFVSSSDYEGISNSMIEAMAVGIPVICTDCPAGGAREMIENMNNGILVPVRDKNKMVEAMITLSKNQKLADKIAKEAVKIRKKLNVNKICKEWEKIIMQVKK